MAQKRKPGEVLKVTDLTKSYGRLKAVDRLSFSVQRGEVLGISGPNGAGKTTLFDLMSGNIAPTKGEVVFECNNITGQPPDRICHAGLVRTFQLNAAFEGLSLLDSVLVGGMFGRNRPGLGAFFGTSREARQRTDEALEFVGLSDRRHVQSSQASVLDLKLTMIAAGFATNPKLLMMDEPVGGLVPSEVDQIADVVRRLRETGITILIIEHVMRFLTSLSDRILVMHHGAQLFDGLPSEMMRDEKVREVYLGKQETAA